MFHSRSILFDSGWRGAFLRHHLTEQGVLGMVKVNTEVEKSDFCMSLFIGKTQFINSLWNFKYRTHCIVFSF